MIYLKEFDSHSSYETELSVGGADISIPNVSYCKDVKDVHYTPYNLVRFYVGEITGTTPQTVKIYTDSNTSTSVTVSEGNKWYSYLLPKNKGLCKIEGGSVKKVVVKADISFEGISPFPAKDKHIIPSSTVEASFKSSNTSNITSMFAMFSYCSGLTSLDLSGWDTSKVTNMTNMTNMFQGCGSLKTIKMVRCSPETIQNITDVKPSGATIVTGQTI